MDDSKWKVHLRRSNIYFKWCYMFFQMESNTKLNFLANFGIVRNFLAIFRKFWLFSTPKLPDMSFLAQNLNSAINFGLYRHLKSISRGVGNWKCCLSTIANQCAMGHAFYTDVGLKIVSPRVKKGEHVENPKLGSDPNYYFFFLYKIPFFTWASTRVRGGVCEPFRRF